MRNSKWSNEETKLAFHLYCQLSFGKLHRGNNEIIELAELVGRTPSAVAMKLVNFASLDPAITRSGRKGLTNASSQDRAVWKEFNADWEGLVVECQSLRQSLAGSLKGVPSSEIESDQFDVDDYSGETKKVLVEQRVKQSFFRRAVLSSYRSRCCMSGLADPRLLIASHIVPWSQDKLNRLNPRNGLCLSAIHDKAFDEGLIALTDDLKVLVSRELKEQKAPIVSHVILPLEGRPIEVPERFSPTPEFVARHRSMVFVDTLRGQKK